MGVTSSNLLSKPVTDKEVFCGEFETYKYACAAMQGWSKTMEDRYVVVKELSEEPLVSLFSVLDGEKGAEVADFCKDNLPSLLQSLPEFRAGKYEEALQQLFVKLDEKLASVTAAVESGATAVVALLVGQDLYVAHVGDCRAVLAKGSKALLLTEDHSPALMVEHKRIEAAGVAVQEGDDELLARGNCTVAGELFVSRAVGHLKFKDNKELPWDQQAVIAKPDVLHVQLSRQDNFLLLATDGLFEVLNVQQVVSSIAKARELHATLAEAVSKLLDTCLPDGGQKNQFIGVDNMTAIVVEFAKQADFVEEENPLQQEVAALEEKVVEKVEAAAAVVAPAVVPEADAAPAVAPAVLAEPITELPVQEVPK